MLATDIQTEETHPGCHSKLIVFGSREAIKSQKSMILKWKLSMANMSMEMALLSTAETLHLGDWRLQHGKHVCNREWDP